MLSFIKKLFAGFALILLATSNFAFAQGEFDEWAIESFDSEILIKKDSTIQVTERIKVDFSRTAKRGIYREIPYKFQDSFNNKITTEIELIQISSDNPNQPNPPVTQYYEGEKFVMQIGDPNLFLNEIFTYEITYKVKNAILQQTQNQENFDELYWNSTGLDWPVEIKKSSTQIKAESPIIFMEATCFTGSFGSTNQDCQHQISENKTEIFIESLNSFMPGEGLTIGIKIKPGTIEHPQLWERIFNFLKNNWIAALPLLVFLLLFWHWKKTGRDPVVRSTIIPHFKPPHNLSPTEVGTIIDERVDPSDLGAAIIDFAVRGYLIIEEIKNTQLLIFSSTDYKLKLKKDLTEIKKDENLREFEQTILDKIFGTEKEITLSSLQNKFYVHLTDIKSKIYQKLVKEGFFPTNPEKVREFYSYAALGIFCTMILLGGFIFEFLGVIGLISIGICGLIIGIFSFLMPKKTIKGAETLNEIKGLKLYIETAEKDRIKFYEKENLFFEKLLPYAVVLGLGDKWANTFKDIYKDPPEWFHSNDMSTFNTIYLVSRLNNMNQAVSTTLTSSPKSASSGGSSFGGGGFSGGGFGGGGGRSW
jgi:hypothetical protein